MTAKEPTIFTAQLTQAGSTFWPLNSQSYILTVATAFQGNLNASAPFSFSIYFVTGKSHWLGSLV